MGFLGDNITEVQIPRSSAVSIVPVAQCTTFPSLVYHGLHVALTVGGVINLLKPTGHVMHQQFNIQQLYVLPTLYLCVLYLSENKQRLVPLTG